VLAKRKGVVVRRGLKEAACLATGRQNRDLTNRKIRQVCGEGGRAYPGRPVPWGYQHSLFGGTLNQPNRRVRTRTHGGVGGVEP